MCLFLITITKRFSFPQTDGHTLRPKLSYGATIKRYSLNTQIPNVRDNTLYAETAVFLFFSV